MRPFRIGVLGGGAMGSLWAARLAPVAASLSPRPLPSTAPSAAAAGGGQDANDVWIYTRWQEHARRIQEQRGVWYQPLEGSRSLRSCQASDSVDEILNNGGPMDIGFVFVKGKEATYTSGVAAHELLRPGGILVTLQNGMGHEEILRFAAGASMKLAIGTTTVGATVEPGIVTLRGEGETVIARGKYSKDRRSGTLDAVSVGKIMRNAGFSTNIVPPEEKLCMLWKKLIVNASINPITALFGIQNGAIHADEPHGVRSLAEGVATEAALVAQKIGLKGFSVEDSIQSVMRVSLNTRFNTSSMLTDVRNGKKTEIETITGWVCSEADRLEIDVPLNKKLLYHIRNIENSPGSERTVVAVEDLLNFQEIPLKGRK